MGVHACAEPLRAEPSRATPVPWDPGQGTSLLTRVAPPHRGRDIPGCDDPVTGLRRDPLGSAAVHAGPSPSSYTTHLRQAPLGGAQVWGCSRAPAGFRVGAGHGALIEYSLTRGGVAAQATSRAPTGRTNPAEVPGGPGGRAFARRVRAAVVANFTLQRSCARGRPGRSASSPARAPSVNKLYSPGGRVTPIRVSGSKFEPGPVTSDVGARREALDLVRASSGSGSSAPPPY